MKLLLIEQNVNDKGSNGLGQPYNQSIGLFVDTETGVEYLVMNGGNAGAITPRLNPDGTLYIHPDYR